MPIARPRRCFPSLALAAALFLTGVVAAPAAGKPSQTVSSDQVSEVAATLASGRVTIIAAHDGFVVAAIGKPLEPGDFLPLIVPLGENDLVVALGAVDWVEPPTGRPVLRLSSQLPVLMRGVSGNAPRLSSDTNFSNIDRIGLAVLGPLRDAARNLHAKIQLPENLPLAELILVRQPVENTGSVWDLSYWLHQRFLQQNFWDTEVQRPRLSRMFPVKNDKSGFLEVSYPPGDQSPGPIDWLSHPTGRLAQYVEAHPKLAKAQQRIAEGKGGKVKLAQLVPLMKTALQTMVPASTPKSLASLSWDTGFAWVIKPPPLPHAKTKRPPGAPTLRSQPHP
jgi:hypothetical protein